MRRAVRAPILRMLGGPRVLRPRLVLPVVAIGLPPHKDRKFKRTSERILGLTGMSKHAFLGLHERLKKVQKDYADKL